MADPGRSACGLDQVGQLVTDDDVGRRTIDPGPGVLHNLAGAIALGRRVPDVDLVIEEVVMGTQPWSQVKRSRADRIATAMEAGTRNRLTGELRLPPERALELLAAWAVIAEERGLDRHDGAYWDAGWPWLVEHAG